MFTMMPKHSGWIEVICGCMFSGKTELMIQRLRRCEYAKQTVVAFKPAIDTRYHNTNIASHAGIQLGAFAIDNASQILDAVVDVDVVGIDEAQFFGDDLVDVCQVLANHGVRVIVACLDMDSRGKAFGPIPRLLAEAEFVDKVSAICVVCGGVATRSQRVVNNDCQVLVGAKGAYEARCRTHWTADPIIMALVAERAAISVDFMSTRDDTDCLTLSESDTGTETLFVTRGGE